MKRTTFLEHAATGVAALALTAGDPAGPPAAASSPVPEPARSPASVRAALAFDRRMRAAAAERAAFQPSSSNGDERRFASRGYLGSFSKGLPHDDRGRADERAFRAMRAAIDARDAKRLDPRTSSALGRLIGETLTDDSCVAGCDPLGIPLDAPARVDDAKTALDARELAWLALTRDVPFARYDGDPLVAAAAADLRTPPHALFRPVRTGASSGPLVSQFALVDVPHPPFGSLAQRHDFFAPGRDYLTDRAAWRAAQDGAHVAAQPVREGRRRYVSTGRDLAAWVVAGSSPFAVAVAVIDALPGAAVGPAWDADAVLGALGLAADVASIATFHQKFGVHLRLRPEHYFGLVDLAAPDLHVDAALLASPALEKLRAAHGNVLLPQAYPAGSPSHPSYPAAHAAFAGAAATVLKAYVREDYVLEKPVVPSADGTALVAYDGEPLRLGAEIDKLAANYAYGRHAAGVHFRQDSDAGLRFGESAAIGVLRDLAAVCGNDFPGFAFATFDGVRVAIAAS